MYENNVNPALAHMDLAQDEIAVYALLVKRAQSSLIASRQAFERANETSITGNCPVKQELTGKLRGQYLALTHFTGAIVDTLDAPLFQRVIATAPQQCLLHEIPQESPKLLALLDCLPEAEREVIQVAVTSLLLLNRGELAYFTQDQVELAENILATGVDNV
ncbi:hypothetical protein [Chlorogloea sp. CCALA 695]|uniref:hypothetical protein n=1 Tax=Chlorogloea sp. CCALA 695 TaxID=2107693 RepID=UPI000D07B80F|nr:hypothetical protein [Chlorogloea sp. CCALA 695]PSB29621.1 hypothetical protein C7B70_18220 [Chlorogloea sp. CCALA 695]